MSELSEGAWTFYDSWAAFPHSRLREDEKRIIGEFMVGLQHPDGGTLGEFSIRFYDFAGIGGVKDIAARLEAFGDSWRALAYSHLIDELAALDDKPQGPDEIRDLLLGLGYEDRTAALRGNHPATCPTCRGRGVLDEVDR